MVHIVNNSNWLYAPLDLNGLFGSNACMIAVQFWHNRAQARHRMALRTQRFHQTTGPESTAFPLGNFPISVWKLPWNSPLDVVSKPVYIALSILRTAAAGIAYC